MKLPADWAILKAIPDTPHARQNWPLEQVKIDYERRDASYAVTIMNFARYIEEHEEPPVDPDLIRARELYAETFCLSDTKAAIMEGCCDSNDTLRVILKALKEK